MIGQLKMVQSLLGEFNCLVVVPDEVGCVGEVVVDMSHGGVVIEVTEQPQGTAQVKVCFVDVPGEAEGPAEIAGCLGVAERVVGGLGYR